VCLSKRDLKKEILAKINKGVEVIWSNMSTLIEINGLTKCVEKKKYGENDFFRLLRKILKVFSRDNFFRFFNDSGKKENIYPLIF
jgi:hypothetical protein